MKSFIRAVVSLLFIVISLGALLFFTLWIVNNVKASNVEPEHFIAINGTSCQQPAGEIVVNWKADSWTSDANKIGGNNTNVEIGYSYRLHGGDDFTEWKVIVNGIFTDTTRSFAGTLIAGEVFELRIRSLAVGAWGDGTKGGQSNMWYVPLDIPCDVPTNEPTKPEAPIRRLMFFPLVTRN